MASLTQRFIPLCEEAGVDLITSVPDGYLVPLIEAAEASPLMHISAAREEECFGIAAGAVMSGKRALVMMQNSGFLNAIGCLATLCMNYKLPMVILVSHRGNIFDQNQYDVEKYRFFEEFIRNSHVFSTSWHAHRDDGNMIKRAFGRAYAASEPTILSLDFSPTDEVAC